MNNWIIKTTCFFLLVTLIVVIYLGNRNANEVNAQQGANAVKLNQEYQQSKTKQHEDEINKWKPNGNPRTYVDDVRYYKALKRVVNISTLGSSVTQGTGASDPSKVWSSLLVNFLSSIDGYTSINLKSNGFGGYTTEKILAEKKVDEVISQKPDIVLFETCILNDHGQSVQIEKTFQNITDVVNKIKTALPETKIILLSSNPRAEDKKNSVGLTLADYAAKTKEFIQSKGWSYIDVYEGFKKQNADMKSLTVDGVHPKDEGYNIWFNIMKDAFEKKI